MLSSLNAFSSFSSDNIQSLFGSSSSSANAASAATAQSTHTGVEASSLNQSINAIKSEVGGVENEVNAIQAIIADANNNPVNAIKAILVQTQDLHASLQTLPGGSASLPTAQAAYANQTNSSETPANATGEANSGGTTQPHASSGTNAQISHTSSSVQQSSSGPSGHQSQSESTKNTTISSGGITTEINETSSGVEQLTYDPHSGRQYQRESTDNTTISSGGTTTQINSAGSDVEQKIINQDSTGEFDQEVLTSKTATSSGGSATTIAQQTSFSTLVDITPDASSSTDASAPSTDNVHFCLSLREQSSEQTDDQAAATYTDALNIDLDFSVAGLGNITFTPNGAQAHVQDAQHAYEAIFQFNFTSDSAYTGPPAPCGTAFNITGLTESQAENFVTAFTNVAATLNTASAAPGQIHIVGYDAGSLKTYQDPSSS